MSDVLAIATAAIHHSMERLETVSRNVANASTQGFKRELRVQTPFDVHLQPQPGNTVTARDWSRGALQFSGRPLDFAIEGDGWFQLQSPQGPLLTRNGAFRLSNDGTLVSQQGWPVIMDGEGRFADDAVALRADNELWSGAQRIARFELVTAAPDVLQPAGPGLFRSKPEAQLDNTQGTLRQGYVEGSNVNSLAEMTMLMEAMRQAETAQRMLRAYDEALETTLTTLGEF